MPPTAPRRPSLRASRRTAGRPEGPPGGGIFTLEGRRAPGLYLVAWILTVGGLALAFVIGPMASTPTCDSLLSASARWRVTLGLAAAAGSQVLERARPRSGALPRPGAPAGLRRLLLRHVAAGRWCSSVGLGADPDQPFNFLAHRHRSRPSATSLVVWLFAVRSGALTWPQMGWPTWQGRGLGADAARHRHGHRGDAAGDLRAAHRSAACVGLLLGVEAPEVLPLSSHARSMGSSWPSRPP